MSKEIRMIKGKLYKEECKGNWEPMETTAVNDAGVANRAIQRLLLSINDIKKEVFDIKIKNFKNTKDSDLLKLINIIQNGN